MAPVAPHQVRLGLEAVVDERNIADINHGPVHIADGDLIQIVQNHRAAVDRDIVLARSYLRRAGRQDDVLSLDCIADVLRRKPPRVESVRIYVDVRRSQVRSQKQKENENEV